MLSKYRANRCPPLFLVSTTLAQMCVHGCDSLRAAEMGKAARQRVTARDIARADGGVTGFAKQLVKTMSEADAERKEEAAGQLRSWARQRVL